MSLEHYRSSPDELALVEARQQHVRLGKLAAKPDPRNLMLARYLPSGVKLPKPPARVARTHEVPAWPMYDNDTLGDCTCAAVGHIVQLVTAAAGRATTPQDSAVTGLYWATGAADDGRLCLDVLNYWRGTGLGPDKIAAYVSVDPRSRSEVKQALSLFGNLYVGVALPLSAQGGTSWAKPRRTTGKGAAGSWGGHCVPIFDYDAKGLTCVTWGAPLRMSWGFFEFYCDEAYTVVTTDWLDAAGASPADAGGFNIAQLESDLAALKA